MLMNGMHLAFQLHVSCLVLLINHDIGRLLLE